MAPLTNKCAILMAMAVKETAFLWRTAFRESFDEAARSSSSTMKD
jgi:hypothetical protein